MSEHQSAANDKEPRKMKVLGTPGPGKGPVLFEARTACDCGCGLKDRFEFCVGRDTVVIDDPAAIRALIIEMWNGYVLLWGPDLPQDDQVVKDKA
jgi:hypothetical protein